MPAAKASFRGNSQSGEKSAALGRPGKPGCFSLLGERRSGKSALAWYTDERNRPRTDLDGLERSMGEAGLELPHRSILAVLERLSGEEAFANEGPTYRFAVPLFRRWIAWRWGPDKVRGEGL